MISAAAFHHGAAGAAVCPIQPRAVGHLVALPRHRAGGCCDPDPKMSWNARTLGVISQFYLRSEALS